MELFFFMYNLLLSRPEQRRMYKQDSNVNSGFSAIFVIGEMNGFPHVLLCHFNCASIETSMIACHSHGRNYRGHGLGCS